MGCFYAREGEGATTKLGKEQPIAHTACTTYPTTAHWRTLQRVSRRPRPPPMENLPLRENETSRCRNSARQPPSALSGPVQPLP